MEAKHAQTPASPEVVAPRIVATPGTCGGKPRIDGSRIRVLDVYVWHELQGKSPDEIVHSFPQLSMADVYAALSYYWAHRDELRIQHEQELREFAELKRTQPSLVERKLRELGSPHAKDDSLSP